jgi:hypothetical protein
VAKPKTAEELLPLVDRLSPKERARLLKLMAASAAASGAAAYSTVPPSVDEFGIEDEPLAWESNGWENVG